MTSRSLNRVQLIGNLTRDPSLRSTSNGSYVCTFGIATNKSWQTAEGETRERAEFHKIVCWNKLAEICAQVLSLGMLVFVEGALVTRVWEDEDGKKRYRTEIKIHDMKLLDNKDKRGVGIEEAKKIAEKGGVGSNESVSVSNSTTLDEKTNDSVNTEMDSDEDISGDDLF